MSDAPKTYVYLIWDEFSALPSDVFLSPIEPAHIVQVLNKQNLNHPRPNCMTEKIILLKEIDISMPTDSLPDLPILGDFKNSVDILEQRSKANASRKQSN